MTSAIGGSFLRQRADGVFVVVSLTLTDLKTRPSTILADNVRISTRGATYSVSDKAFAIFDNGLVLLVNLQPRLPKKVVAVYDIPRNAVHGAKLRVQDIYSGQTATIKLGL